MPRYPVATYRFQLNKDFPFAKAQELIPFLKTLGISDLYASPVFVARPGSTHGYDVVDPSRANPELGGDEGFDRMAAALRDAGMGLVLDIVPNHMAASSENAWWTDVLESGPSSAYAAFFDVEWDTAWERGEEKIFLPVLGSPYGTALENREIQIALDRDGFSVNYYTIHLPLDPSTYEVILGQRREAWPQNPAFEALTALLERLPGRAAASWDAIEARRREIPSVKSQLWSLYESQPEVRAFVDAGIALFNGVKGDPVSFNLLDDLLSRQGYRLAWWHGARERLNYRRFFDVSELIGVRVENAEVFAATHSAILRWIEEGKVTGLRVDHVDGLFAPRAYLERLAAIANRPYIVVEKILIGDESLPENWPVDGTSGYDFLGMVNGVFIDNIEALRQTYARFTGLTWSFADAAYEQKRWIIRHLFRGEMFALSLHLELIADTDRHGRDLSPDGLRWALAEITACLPVYRTYLEREEMPDRGRACIQRAVAEGARRNPDLAPDIVNFIRRVLMCDFPPGLSETDRGSWKRFVMRWQQLTGPITAKGIEDTTLYVYNPLISMNEVGGQHEAVSLQRFHDFNSARQRRWPGAMSATSTHDTKRSEDVRARLNVLSEIPAEWDRYLFRWARWNRDKKIVIDGRPIPDPNEEIFLYQTLLGVWPFDERDVPSVIDRVKQYAVKAAREAKVYSTWIKPDEEHERAIHAFLDAILSPANGNRFLQHFVEFQRRIAFFGALNGLSQTLLKITAPGIPDFYQNTEAWDFSLVDPDNRRFVDTCARLSCVAEMGRWTAQVVLSNWTDGRIKTFVTHRALGYRGEHPRLFLEGEYIPVEVEGALSESVVVYARRHSGDVCLSVVPRFVTRIHSTPRAPLGRRAWRDTVLLLPEGWPTRWTNILTGEHTNSAELAEILSAFPIALLAAR